MKRTKCNRKPHIVSDMDNFQARLFRAFLLVGIPIFAAITVCSFFFLQHSTNGQLRQSQDSELATIGEQFFYVLKDTENISEEILYNIDVQDMLHNSLDGEQYPSDTAVAHYINSIIANRDFINSIVITDTDHTLFSTERAYTGLSSFQNISQKWWYPSLASGSRPYGWYPLGAKTGSDTMPVLQNGTPQSENDILFARPIYSTRDYETLLGYMIIYLNNTYMQDVWDSNTWGETSNLLLFDSTGQLIASNATGEDYAQIFASAPKHDAHSDIVRHNRKRYIISTHSFGLEGWTLRMITPYSEVNYSTVTLTLELLLLIITFVLILFILSQSGAKNIALPINRLSGIMDNYRSRESAPADETSSLLTDTASYESRKDEIGQIYRSYAQMRDRIDLLIRENYLKGLEKKDAELALLQSQINPHFLYNTLNSINWLALANGQEEISQMINALSNTFRLSLMKNNHYFVELSQEIEYVKNYLILQKFRYGDRLTYSFGIPDTIPELYIPRFILQPVVENALKHGIDSMEDGGAILIRLDITEDIRITVVNDNDQIDLEKMKQILSFNPETTELLSFEKEGYGIQNIHRRILLYCGEGYGLSYEAKDHRTYCTLRLPIRKTL